MCGRFALTSSLAELQEIFGFPETPHLAPRYNIAPTTDITAVRGGDDGRPHYFSAHWGLIPTFASARGSAASMMNARSETVREKPAFRAAFQRRRCLIPANGFYEWEKPDKTTRQPWFIAVRDRPLIAFAGLWESGISPEGRPVESCTILTVSAAANIAFIHPRMPVILKAEDYRNWLSGTAAEEVLAPLPPPELRFYRVSARVGNVRNESAALLDPADALPLQPSLF